MRTKRFVYRADAVALSSKAFRATENRGPIFDNHHPDPLNDKQECAMETQELHRGRLIDHLQLVVRDVMTVTR